MLFRRPSRRAATHAPIHDRNVSDIADIMPQSGMGMEPATQIGN